MAKTPKNQPIDASFDSLEGLVQMIRLSSFRSASVNVTLSDCKPLDAAKVYTKAKNRILDKSNPKKHLLREFELPTSKAFMIDTVIERAIVSVTVSVTDQDMRAAT